MIDHLQRAISQAATATAIIASASRGGLPWALLAVGLWVSTGCKSAREYRLEADQAADRIIDQKQRQALGETEPFSVEEPARTLRRRLLIEQDLPVSHPASLGSVALEPTEHWPEDENYLEPGSRPRVEPIMPGSQLANAPLKLSLLEALQVAARSSRAYQSRKEQVYLTALDLDLERDEFDLTFAGTTEGGASQNLGGSDNVAGAVGGATGSVVKRFKNGLTLTGRIGLDLVKLLTQSRDTSLGVFADASISIPLLRGAGEHIVTEPLTQAERNALYAIYQFERFKRVFAVDIASDYLGVLEQLDQVHNAAENYRSLVTAGRRARRLADAGQLPEIDVDQAVQNELQARERWISAQQTYERALDAFKLSLGLPTDARIKLDRSELERLAVAAEVVLTQVQQEAATVDSSVDGVDLDAVVPMPTASFPAADDPIELVPPSREGGGPLEMPEPRAIDLALAHRLDLRVAQGEVYDAQRGVMVAANGLLPELTLLGTAATGEGRTLAGAALPDSTSLRLDQARYDALLTLDLPLERTLERNVYRASLIGLEQSVRQLQALEDEVKFAIRSDLRQLLVSREELRIQALAVQVAQRRVESTNLFLKAGRAEIRDLLEAQEDLIDAQNALTSALVDYRIAELQLQRDLGLLEVDENGLWHEFTPGWTSEPPRPEESIDDGG